MAFLASLSTLDVHGHADGQRVLLGQLAYDAQRFSSSFQWSEQALAVGTEWSPFHLPLTASRWSSSPKEFHLSGLPGLIHDALPDGWGMLLMDRTLANGDPQALGPLQRLAFLGERSWGALEFSSSAGLSLAEPLQVSLKDLAIEARALSAGSAASPSPALLVGGSIPQGARPKAMVGISADCSEAWVGKEQLPQGYRHALVKFAAAWEDPMWLVLEYCYGEAARTLGIDTAPAHLVQAGPEVGLVLDRFDRVKGEKQHVHSMAGILHTTHRIANSDWEQVAQVLTHLQADRAHFEQAFIRAVFNAVFCVRDDHTKNLAFLRQGNSWGLAPAFDLAYSEGPGGYHTMTYANHSQKNVALKDLQRLAMAFGVGENQVVPLVQRMQAQRQAMLTEAKARGVPAALLKIATKRFRDIDQSLAIPKRG